MVIKYSSNPCVDSIIVGQRQISVAVLGLSNLISCKKYKLDQSTTFAKVLVDGAWKSSYSLAVSMLSFLPRPKETIVKALTWFMTLLFDHTLLQHYDSMNKTQPLRCSHAVHTDIFHDSFFMIWNRDLVVSASHQIGYFRRM